MNDDDKKNLFNLFKAINKNFFENKLKITVKETKYSYGADNFVVIVEKDETIYALRIAKNSDEPEIEKLYKNIKNKLDILSDIFPKIEILNDKVIPYFILYEYFDHDVYKYLHSIDKDEKKNYEFRNIIDQCIKQIKFVYDNKIRCVDIKPNNFVLKFTDSKPIVKMIDIDDCFIFDDTIEETHRNMLLLMTLYQFYLFFDNKKYIFDQKDYIMSKIKEKTLFFNLETQKRYENLFKIFDYYKHYEYLNYYYKNYNNENIKFDFIWDALKPTDEIISPPKKKQKTDGKRSHKGRHTRKKHSKKRSRRRGK
jgi:hypothetical protein